MQNKIPKMIHYCWFGGKPLPESAKRCIESWKKYCPDYEIKRWDESNFDIYSIPFIRQAYDAKKWAFVTDYARLKIIFENGGIYFDTDVELLRNIDDLLLLEGFMGTEDGALINTGVGFASIKKHQFIQTLMNDYSSLSFPNDSKALAKIACPEITTSTFEKYGYIRNNEIQTVEGITIFPEEYFCPINCQTYNINITENTYSIHHYDASWKSSNKKIIRKLIRLTSKVLGRERTLWIKEKIKNIMSEKS